MKSYTLQIAGGHLLFDDGNGLILIDTGSPKSFHQDGLITIMGKEHSVPTNFPLYNIGPEYISQRVGVKVKGLMGMNIMSNIPILIDVPNERVTFGENLTVNNNIYAGNTMGVPSVIAEVDGRQAKLLIDTGAFISYINPSFVGGKEPIRTESDFSPMMLGGSNDEFETNIYQLDTTISDREMALEYGTLPTMLNMAIGLTGAQGIIGYLNQ